MRQASVHIRLRYVVSDKDRHGNVRYYVRLPGQKKQRIRGIVGSEEFMAEYHLAVKGTTQQPLQAAEIKKGSFRHLCVKYFSSTQYKALDESTRNWQRRALDSICVKHGAKPVAQMESRHVRKIRNEKTKAAANSRMKAMRAMFAWANEEEEFEGNPTIGVKNVKYTERGHHSWTPEEIEQFYQRHPRGTQARLAIDLIRFTTGRREDIPRFGPQHIKDGRIQYRQGKNEDRAPIDMDIPLHPDLAASIEAYGESKHLKFLITAWGKPFSTNGFGNKFKDWCRQADLPHCSAHGVRKATAAELAENDATPHQIGAITGHTSLKEIERYTRGARKAKLATAAMKLVGQSAKKDSDNS